MSGIYLMYADGATKPVGVNGRLAIPDGFIYPSFKSGSFEKHSPVYATVRHRLHGHQ